MMSGFGGFMMILVIAIVIAAIVVLVRHVPGNSAGRRARNHTTLDILDERYARGDINLEEYKKRRADLEH
ncbi:SHOCT domain-containing protein (plasmid) [Burkholderia thailandensis]|nr:SHOCT domain-containing protein [Burkholderia thailandensis]QRA15388.1 SHOCT domain-containing protein [Burkholderia thailandensis]